MPEDIEKAIEQALNNFFDSSDEGGRKRFIDVQKIPRICDDLTEIRKHLGEIDKKLGPITEIFDSTKGFNNISRWILKSLAMIGAAIVGFYALIELIKKVGK